MSTVLNRLPLAAERPRTAAAGYPHNRAPDRSRAF